MGENEKTVVKGLSFLGVGIDANCVQVDVKDGKIRQDPAVPLRLEVRRKPWRMEARGQGLRSQHEDAHPALHPRLQEPHQLAQPHHVSRSSGWTGTPTASATPRTAARASTCASPGTRPPTSSPPRYGASRRSTASRAILAAGRRARRDQGGARRPRLQPAAAVAAGRLHAADPQPRQLGGLVLGRQARVGHANRWARPPISPTSSRTSPSTRNMLIYSGCDPETTTWGWGGQTVSQLCYWFTELGIKQVYICPDVNYGAAVHADKWIPILPNTDAALYLAIAYQWLHGGHLRQGVRRDPRGGLRQVRGLRPGRGRRRPQDPQVGRGEDRRPVPHHQGPGPGLGQRPHLHGARQRRQHVPRPLRHREHEDWRSACWACRAWANRAATC